MSRLEAYFDFAESIRVMVCVIGGVMVAIIAWADAQLPTMSIGFLYRFPILLTAAALNSVQIIILSGLCSVLRETFDPTKWGPGAVGRLLAAGAGFAMAGFFVTGLHQRGRMLQKHLRELEEELRRREDAESQIEALIQTSPLAILTLDRSGRVLLANESACRLLEFGEQTVQGADMAEYLPILPPMFQRHQSGNVRTNVECKARRRSGEVFLANIWVSTYLTSAGRGLAAVIWHASENLRDRERAGLDSMLATSRILIGAMSHEIRNLASAAAAAYESGRQKEAAIFNDRQRRVLRFVLEGLSNKEIAWRLQISESYVKALLQGLFKKTGVRTRGQLVRVAFEQYESEL